MRQVTMMIVVGVLVFALGAGRLGAGEQPPKDTGKAPPPKDPPKVAAAIASLEKAVEQKDKIAAEDALAELEKLIPEDERMDGLRKKVARVPGLSRERIITLPKEVKMEFVLIRPGSFTMGVEDGDAQEKPAHRVTITTPFYMGKCEVTQEQWEAVMGENPAHFKGAKNPVESVSWDDCQTFIKRLAERAPGNIFRLPTEAEWEFACRAGSTTEFCFGDDEAGLKDYAWFRDNSGNKTQPVGGKKPNAWGLFDMHGNIWEWCADWKDAYGREDKKDPTGPAVGQWRILRGGAWNNPASRCRSATRFWNAPESRFYFAGLRLVCVAVPR